MKNKYYYLLQTIIMATILSVGLFSCSKDDKDDGLEKTETVSDRDPEGTVVINMNNGAKGNYYDIGIGYEIHIDEANNFVGYNSSVQFATIGIVSGLSKITTIPSTGWSKSAAVVPGTGYVVKSLNRYARLFVVDYTVSTTGGIMGATVKYQSPFQLSIELDATSISFSNEAGEQSVKLKNPTSVTVEDKPEWCTVTTNMDEITVKVTENLSAQQYTGDITLKNAVGKAKLSITQKASMSPKFEKGRGVEKDPYQIKSAKQLENVTMALNAYYELIDDISLASSLNANGSGWDPIGKRDPFQGSFDGKGHTISDLWIKRPTTDHVGLFGVTKNAKIKGIRVKTSTIGITGLNYVGGIVGSSNNTTISQCSLSGSVSGKGRIAGICGSADNTKVTECYSEGTISSSNDYSECLCGIGGTEVKDCYSLCSFNWTSINGIDCRAISYDVRWINNISNCYYSGKLLGKTDTYGHYNFSCSGLYTYFDSNVTGRSDTNGRTTSQMMSQSNYEGWDFVNVWKIIEGKSYPTLRCFEK